MKPRFLQRVTTCSMSVAGMERGYRPPTVRPSTLRFAVEVKRRGLEATLDVALHRGRRQRVELACRPPGGLGQRGVELAEQDPAQEDERVAADGRAGTAGPAQHASFDEVERDQVVGR